MHNKLSHRLRLRWPYLMAYACLTVTGVLVAAAPSPAAREQLKLFLPVWIIFFIVGGLSSSAGVLWGRWSGEAFGLPLLSCASVVYAVILMVRSQLGPSSSTSLLAFAFLIMGFGLGLFGRWLEVLKLLRAARELRENGRQRASWSSSRRRRCGRHHRSSRRLQDDSSGTNS